MKNEIADASSAGSGRDLVQNYIKPVAMMLGTAWLARLAFIAVLPVSAHSDDVVGWEAVAHAMSAGQNPYNTTTFLNWPPLWMQIVYGLASLSRWINLSFLRTLQLFLATVESAVILLTWKTIQWAEPALSTSKLSAAHVATLALSLNPIAILLTCQHVNFDIIIGLCALTSVAMLIKFHQDKDPVNWLCACAAIGIGILTKTVPFVLVPLLAIGARHLTAQARLLGAALIVGPCALGLSIIYVLGPSKVTENVLRYRAVGGYFGFSGLMFMADCPTSWLSIYASCFTIAMLLGIALLSRKLFQLDTLPAPALVLLAATLLIAIPAIGPGYASQYAYWFLPLLAVAIAIGSAEIRRAIIIWMIVAMFTNLVQYAFTPSLGASLLKAFPHNMRLHEIAHRYADQQGETTIRLPLFGVYLMLLWVAANAVRRDIKSSSHVRK